MAKKENIQSDLIRAIKSNCKQMNLITGSLQEIVKNCAGVDQSSIKIANENLAGYKQITASVAEICQISIKNSDVKTTKNNMNNLKTIVNIMHDFIFDTGINMFVNVSSITFNPLFMMVDMVIGVVKKIQQLNSLLSLSKLLRMRLKMIFLKNSIKGIYNSIQDMMNELTMDVDTIKNGLKGFIMQPVFEFFTKVEQMLTVVDSISLKKILLNRFKMRFLRSFIQSFINNLNEVFKSLSINVLIHIIFYTTLLQLVFDSVKLILDKIRDFISFKTVLWFWTFGKIKLQVLKYTLNYIKKIVETIDEVDFNISRNVTNILSDMLKISLVLYSIDLFVKIIKKIETPFIPIFRWKINRIKKILVIISDLIDSINNFIDNFNKKLSQSTLNIFIKNLTLLVYVILKLMILNNLLTLLVTQLIISSPLFIIGASIGVIGLMCLYFTLQVIEFILNKISSEESNLSNDKILIAQNQVSGLVKLFGFLSLLGLTIITSAISILPALFIWPILYFGIKLLLLGVNKICESLNSFIETSKIQAAESVVNIIANLFIKLELIMVMIIAMVPTITIINPSISVLLLAISNLFEKLNELNTTIDSETVQKTVQVIEGVFKSLNSLMIKLLLLTPIILLGTMAAIILMPGILMFSIIITSICKIIIQIKRSIDYQSVQNSLNTITTIFINIGLTLLLLAAFAIIIPIIYKLILTGFIYFILFGVLLAKTLSIFQTQLKTIQINKITNQIKRIYKLFKNLIQLAFLTITTSIVLVTAVPAVLLIWVFVTLMSKVVIGIAIIMSSMKKVIKNISKAINKISFALFKISLLVSMFILTAALMAVGAAAALIMAVSMIIITINMLIVFGCVWILSKIVSKIGIMDLLKSILVLAIVNIMLLLLLATAIILKNLTEAIDGIDYLAILGFLGMVVVITLILAVIGWIAMITAPILVPAAIAMVVLSVALLIIVGALYLVAWCLNQISMLVIDGQKVAAVIGEIFAAADTVINAIFQKPKADDSAKESGDEPWWKSVLNWLGDSTVGKLVKALASMVYIAQILASIYMIKWIADCLNQIQTIQLKSADIQKGVTTIFDTADLVIKQIENRKTKDLDKACKKLLKYEDIADLLEDIYAELDGIAYNPNISKQCMELVDMISQLNISFNDVDDKKITNAMKSYTNFLKQIDNTNIDKLKETKNVFEQMARFSESINGNFEALAETLNEKIAPLLEELKESLDTVEKNTTQVASRPTTTPDIEKQNIFNKMQESGQTKNLTKNEIEQIVDNKYKDNVQNRYGIDEIVSKLSALIDLFQNGDAMVRTT